MTMLNTLRGAYGTSAFSPSSSASTDSTLTNGGAIDMHSLLLAHAATLMQAAGGDAKDKIDSMRQRQSHGREARDVANQIETLINQIGTDTSKTVKVGDGIRKFFDKYDLEITIDDSGKKQTMQQWEKRTHKFGENGYAGPSGSSGDYRADHLRALKAAAESRSEAATDSRTIEQIEINKFLQEYNGVSTLANTIISSRGQQLNQINGSMRS
jgi:secreted effector protein SseB